MTLILSLAKFSSEIDLNNLPGEVIEKAKTCLLNGYGVALGSFNTPFYPVATKTIMQLDGQRESGVTIFGCDNKTTVSGAAFANAALFHGRAQEDTCGVAHFGTILIPLLTAIVENGDASIEDLLPALIAGYEVGGVIESEFSSITTPKGLRASPLYGSIAAAAAVARIWKLSIEQTAAAIANACSFTGGILQSFGDGSDEWRYQVGVAGRTGLLAASLAFNGSNSSLNALEGDSGFIRAYSDIKKLDSTKVTKKLGKNWSILRVTFKPYPVCALNQTPVSAALQLREQLSKEQLDNIKNIDIRVNTVVAGYAGMDTCGPFTSISGSLMSMQFCVATALLKGIPTVTQMKAFDDKKVNDLMSVIKIIPDESKSLLACQIEVETYEGESFVVDLDFDHEEYNFKREKVLSLIRSIGNETGIDRSIYDGLEKFVNELPQADLNDVLNAFKEVSKKVNN